MSQSQKQSIYNNKWFMLVPTILTVLATFLILIFIVYISVSVASGSLSFSKQQAPTLLSYIFVAASGIILCSFAFFAIFQFRPKISINEYISNSRSESATKTIDRNAEYFINMSNISFYFANRSQIEDFYNEYFKEPTIESLVSEITGESSRGVKGNLKSIIEAGIDSKDISKWVSNIKIPDLPLTGKFLRYQRETVKNGQVTLGLDEVEIELTGLSAFREAVKEMEEVYAISIDKQAFDGKITQLRESAAGKTLSKLEQATGWVLVKGKYKIEEEGDYYKCTYWHPVNTFLSAQSSQVTISVLIASNSLEENIKGNFKQSVGRSIPLHIYGKVWQPISRYSQVWDLQITPIAVY